jgi:hypothetical protein
VVFYSNEKNNSGNQQAEKEKKPQVLQGFVTGEGGESAKQSETCDEDGYEIEDSSHNPEDSDFWLWRRNFLIKK